MATLAKDETAEERVREYSRIVCSRPEMDVGL
jgi:hypothetical protein